MYIFEKENCDRGIEMGCNFSGSKGTLELESLEYTHLNPAAKE